VIAQYNFLSSNFLILNLDIYRCPLCGGSKVPPNIPILF